jgi:hypothetical protein
VSGPPGDAVRCEAVVAASPDEVFRWFVQPELLVRWIGVDAQLEPRPGGAFRFKITDGEWCSGRYLEVYALAAPLLGPAVRRSITRDLRNLRRILEAPGLPTV